MYRKRIRRFPLKGRSTDMSNPFTPPPGGFGFGPSDRRAFHQQRRQVRREFRDHLRDHVRDHQAAHDDPSGAGLGFGPGRSFGPGRGFEFGFDPRGGFGFGFGFGLGFGSGSGAGGDPQITLSPGM